MSDFHISVPEPDAETRTRVRERLYAFCFPNIPHTTEEQEAFEQAALLQYAHEETARAQESELPPGTQAFRIGDFQMSVDSEAAEGRLNRKTICPGAYGLLLRHGLLYRGAEGRRGV